MREPLDMTRVWTAWELRGSVYASEWCQKEGGQPLRDYNPRGEMHAPLTVWEIADDDLISGDLVRAYAYRMN